jgi:hypothetical protein
MHVEGCDNMKEYVRIMDGLPLILKVLLAFPGIDGFAYGFYRIAKGRILEGVIWIFVGFFLFWILDIYSLLTKGRITFFV